MAVHNNVESFLKNHPALNFTSDINEICQPLKQLGILQFGHNHVDAQGRLSGLNSDPKFVEIYYKNHYYKKGLHTVVTNKKRQFFLWDDLLYSDEVPDMYVDLMKMGKGHMFTIHETQGDVRDCYHFATTIDKQHMNATYLQNIDKLYSFIRYYKNKMAEHKKLQDMFYNNKLEFNMQSFNYFDVIRDLGLQDSPALAELHNCKRIYTGSDPRAYLTPREFECLTLIAEGKNFIEVATILNTTQRTIKEHVKNMKQKLNCKSLFQLGVVYANLISD